MLPPLVKLLVVLGILVTVMLLVPPEVESKVRVIRQKPKTTVKPATTAKPGATAKPGTTVKPGATAKPGTTAKPGAKTTTVAPGGGGDTATDATGVATTTAKPGTKTTAKPGTKTTAKPGGGKPTTAATGTATDETGGEMTEGPPLTIVTQIPVADVPGFTYLTQYMGSAFYISDDKLDKDGAMDACNNLQVPGMRFALAGLKKGLELDHVSEVMDATGITEDVMISVVQTTDKEGKTVHVSTGLFGQFIETAEAGARKKRNSDVISYLHRRTRQAKGKQNKKAGGSAAAAPSAALGDVFVTVSETHYPWLANWTDGGTPPGCVDTTKCAPTVCTVTTPACQAETQDCTVKEQAACSVQPSGSCSMVCENCKITKPECYVQEPKCVVIQDRTCTIDPPKCTSTNDNCTIERPECVSKQPPCNVTINQSPNCTTPEQCLTPQGMECKEVSVPCADPNGCKVQECTPLAICIKPDYCRMEQIICPPVETFCPPEIIKCPPPKVECEEPVINCEEPKIYCPPPTVVCTRPVVNCSSPTVNCPNVVTTCPNPDIECPPPIIKCPPPMVVCTPPANPCPVDPGIPGIGFCPDMCKDGQCSCVKLKKNGNAFEHAVGKCEEQLKYICEGGMVKSGGGGGGGGGGPPKKPKTTAAPKTTKKPKK